MKNTTENNETKAVIEKRRQHTASRRRARSHLSEMQYVSGDYKVLVRPFGE